MGVEQRREAGILVGGARDLLNVQLEPDFQAALEWKTSASVP